MRISPRYPLVEGTMGVLWGSAGLLYGMGPRTAPCIVLLSFLLVLSLIDLDTMRLPNVLVGLLFSAGVALAAVAEFTDVAVMPLVPMSETSALGSLTFGLLGALTGAGLSFLIARAYSSARGVDGFGMGDVKLLGAVGVFVGPYVLLVLFIASLMGALWGVLSNRVESLRSRIPFGPFIALATLVTLWWGVGLWSWYAHSVGLA